MRATQLEAGDQIRIDREVDFAGAAERFGDAPPRR
jgi:hypothetical protein